MAKRKSNLPARYKDGLWLTKDNRLIGLHGSMTPLNYKLTNYFLLLAAKTGRLHNLEAHATELARILKIKSTNVNGILLAESKRIPKNTVDIQDINDPEKVISLSIIPIMSYNHGTLIATVNPMLEKYISSLAGSFTKENIALLNECSIYPAMRLYEVCLSWMRTGIAYFSVDEWRSLLGATKKSYTVFAHFKHWVLSPAINEVNAKTDLVLEPEFVKQGRITTHVRMHITKKTLTDASVLDNSEADTFVNTDLGKH